MNKSISLIESGEFIDILIPCLSEINYKTFLNKSSKNGEGYDIALIRKIREFGERINNIANT